MNLETIIKRLNIPVMEENGETRDFFEVLNELHSKVKTPEYTKLIHELQKGEPEQIEFLEFRKVFEKDV